MARRKKRPVKSRKTIAFTRKQLGIMSIIIGGLYFFAVFMAKESPVLDMAQKIFSAIMGTQGLHAMFAILTLGGIGLLARDDLVSTTIKQAFLTGILGSSLLNFNLLSTPGALLDYAQCLKYGGYLGWPLLWTLQRIFGENNPGAIKLIIIVMCVALIIWILRSRNVSLPSMPKIRMAQSTTPVATKKPIKKKAILEEEYEEEEEYETEEVVTPKSQRAAQSGSVMSLLKSTIKEKVDQKLQEKKEAQKVITFPKDKPSYDITLLEGGTAPNFSADEEYLMQKANALQKKLAEFSIPVEIKGFNVGPSVVQIKIAPMQGIKVSSIESYQKDLTLALKTKSLRILAPIPGTDVVGIEIPNPQPQLIRLRQIMGTHGFAEAISKNLTNLVLGIGIDGKPVRKPLETMPHLLIAGATGSGKSIGVNTFIMSLIYQNSPSELKFLMIDPKQVELGMYDGIPYLLAPVETVPDKALKILKWGVNEMERRYTMLKHARVKKLDEYNAKVKPEEAMPRIVIIIDELADLMMNRNTKKDTENCITRIAQKARAVGIHLIVATQRPSVDVVTGLIKANIPTRIAFSVVSQIDSRTILDVKGAEELLGKGDMLYMDPTQNIAVRMQGPLITTEEIDTVVAAIKEKYMKDISEQDIYDPELMGILSGKNVGSGMGNGMGGDGNDDELIQQAIEIIRQTNKASATLFQRKLGVGFARAARIMDALEDQGMIGPQDGAKPREIYL